MQRSRALLDFSPLLFQTLSQLCFHSTFLMGRRAKNKQGAPAPLREAKASRPSSNKSGKRKADDEDENGGHRPVKRIKGSTGPGTEKSSVRPPAASSARGPKTKAARPNGAKPSAKNGKGKQKAVVEESEEGSDEDEFGGALLDDRDDSDGWEDVDEDDTPLDNVEDLSDIDSDDLPEEYARLLWSAIALLTTCL